jgi:protein kinase C substrate 80K-H
MSDVSAARNRHQTLNRELDNLNNDIRRDTETLEKMSKGFGPDAEWKKLDGTCIDKVHGE